MGQGAICRLYATLWMARASIRTGFIVAEPMSARRARHYQEMCDLYTPPGGGLMDLGTYYVRTPRASGTVRGGAYVPLQNINSPAGKIILEPKR